MGKKGDKGQPAVDTRRRINYLYQASHIPILSCEQVSRNLIQTLSSVSQRAVVSLNPTIKRTFCKRCKSLLVPGLTCTTRVRPNRQTHVVVRCLQCGLVKRSHLKKLLKKSHASKIESTHTMDVKTENSTAPALKVEHNEEKIDVPSIQENCVPLK